jgi:hypothetical protein
LEFDKEILRGIFWVPQIKNALKDATKKYLSTDKKWEMHLQGQ